MRQLVQVEYGRLQSGAHASCICMHPRQPVVAVVRIIGSYHYVAGSHVKAGADISAMQGALGLVAEYDMYGAKLGSSEIIVAPVCLAYSKDGSLLIAVLKVEAAACCSCVCLPL